MQRNIKCGSANTLRPIVYFCRILKSIMEQIERHPLEPFVPEGAQLLMLGSFPPPHARWSMEFFYPNFQNDMWRIMGLLFYANKAHFELAGKRKFDVERVVDFCRSSGIAIFDVASAVIRLNNNASDKFLTIAEPTDIGTIVARMPACRAIVTTGEKATDTIVERYGCSKPKVGQCVNLTIASCGYNFFRMPSSSRAYPLALERKADVYKGMFCQLGML